MASNKNMGAQIYGYAVCLVAVVTFIMAMTAFVTALMSMSDSQYVSGSYGSSELSLASFDTYKLDVQRSLQGSGGSVQVPDDQTLKSMYEAAKNDKIATERRQAIKSMTVSGMLIFISIVLFFVHWRWMKRISAEPVVA
ncbi:MAG: hypothetical protein JST14_11590 [Bacteroidetes bacterium]|nr:hypothetical protein [Bacteroidota bacterium]MBS1979284.1 hypothetical protein [Bacteroidota bacterium]